MESAELIGRPERIFDLLLKWNTWIQKGLGGLILVVIAIVIIGDVIMREIGVGGISGASRLAVYLMIVFGFLCIPVATAEGNHLRIKILDISWGYFEPIRPRLQYLCSGAVMVGFTWFSLQFVLESVELNEKSAALGIPMWWVQVVMPISFASLCFQNLIYAVWPVLAPSD